jgi:hypothetical protein
VEKADQFLEENNLKHDELKKINLSVRVWLVFFRNVRIV